MFKSATLSHPSTNHEDALLDVKHFNLPCMNSKSLFTTVFRNRQWARKNRGYCPTTYMIFEAMMALLSFPLFCSHKPNRSWRRTRRLILKRYLDSYDHANEAHWPQCWNDQSLLWASTQFQANPRTDNGLPRTGWPNSISSSSSLRGNLASWGTNQYFRGEVRQQWISGLQY